MSIYAVASLIVLGLAAFDFALRWADRNLVLSDDEHAELGRYLSPLPVLMFVAGPHFVSLVRLCWGSNDALIIAVTVAATVVFIGVVSFLVMKASRLVAYGYRNAMGSE